MDDQTPADQLVQSREHLQFRNWNLETKFFGKEEIFEHYILMHVNLHKHI